MKHEWIVAVEIEGYECYVKSFPFDVKIVTTPRKEEAHRMLWPVAYDTVREVQERINGRGEAVQVKVTF